MITRKKFIKSGNILELFEYGKAVKYGKSEKESCPRIKKVFDMNNPIIAKIKLENRKRSLENSRAKLKRLINANAGQWKDENDRPFVPLFLTLTFAENITDIKKANYIFTKFKQRLDYEITGKKRSYLKYVGIIEFQKRGAVHYHVLIFNMPFMENIYDRIKNIWGKGFIIVRSIKEIQNVASYVCKYMTKAKADERLCGQKSYFTSKGLKKPFRIFDQKRVENIINIIPKSIIPYTNEFDSEYFKKIKYTRYDLKDCKEDNEIIDNLLENNLI